MKSAFDLSKGKTCRTGGYLKEINKGPFMKFLKCSQHYLK